MRAFTTSAVHPRFISRVTLGLGVISAMTLGCVASSPDAGDPPRAETRMVEVVATNGDPVVVINGERHVGEVRMDESSGMMILVDEAGEIRRFPIPATVLRGMSATDEPGRERSGAVVVMSAEPPSAMLGISMADVEDGVQVAGVMPDTAAARVGLREGDVIFAIGGERGDMGRVDTSTLAQTISERSPGDRVRLKVRREGRILTLAPTLGAGGPDGGFRDEYRERRDPDSMESFAREMEAMIREMIADRFGDDEGDMSMEFDIEFEEESHHDRGSDHDSDRHDDHEGPWEEMFRHVEGMMEEARHETAGWMEEMAERSGHWSEEVEHRMNEFAEMTEGRMNEFAEAFERELQRVMERQDEGRRETEMMFRQRDLELRERGMEFQRNFGESGRKLQEQLQRFAEQHQRLAEENRRLNERVDRLEQAIRRMMSEGGPDRDRDDDRMRGRDSEDARERSAERGRRGAERNANRNDRRGSDAGSDRPRDENQDRPRDRGGDRD